MSFIKKFLKLLFLGIIVLGLVFLSANYLLLSIESNKLKADLDKARRLSRRPAHTTECQLENTNIQEFSIKGYQVRFTNDFKYIVEAVCSNAVKGTITVSEGELSYGVKKQSGYSGMFFGIEPVQNGQSSVVLSLGRLNRVIRYLDNRVITKNLADDQSADYGNIYAQTTCSGWGYQCCDPVAQVGVGNQAPGFTLDCSNNCYSSCNSRPVVLFFNSDPPQDINTRAVTIRGNNQLVVFSHSVQSFNNLGVEVLIDFGDGESAQTTNLTDQLSHIYSCNQSLCVYQATLTLKDSQGLIGVENRLSSIVIRLVP
jgi:hypothetical protein